MSWYKSHEALWGYLVSGVIFTILLYSLLWQVHDSNVQSCEARNVTREGLTRIVRVIARSHNVSGLPDFLPLDCTAAYPHPWPFNLVE